MNNRGFTLMELIVTLALLAIMTAIAVPATSGWRKSVQYKAAAREVVSVLRRGRSMAVQQNQNIEVKIDLANKQFLLDGSGTAFPRGVNIEAANTEGAWEANHATITFRPQGTASDTIFVRIDENDNLVVMVDSKATGLAHM